MYQRQQFRFLQENWKQLQLQKSLNTLFSCAIFKSFYTYAHALTSICHLVMRYSVGGQM